MDVGAVKAPTIRRSQVMQTITTIGLDIAKSGFQVHGVDNNGKVVIRRQLKRRYFLAFFEKLHPCVGAVVASSPVPRHTSGHASCRHLAIPYGWCRRPRSSLTSNGRRTMRPTQRPS